MSQSTPIAQLKQQQQQEPSVEEMLKEMEVPDTMNMDSINYAMDESQIPPPKMDQNFLQPNGETVHPQPVEKSKGSEENSILGINIGNGGTMMTKCINLLKHSGIIFLLVFIVSLPQVNRSVFTKIPGMLEESGEINIKGVMLKAVIVTLLFLVISFFL